MFFFFEFFSLFEEVNQIFSSSVFVLLLSVIVHSVASLFQIEIVSAFTFADFFHILNKCLIFFI